MQYPRNDALESNGTKISVPSVSTTVLHCDAKAFDTINHTILFRKIQSLSIPSEINVGYFISSQAIDKQSVRRWTVAVASYHAQYCSGLRNRIICLFGLFCRSYIAITI